MIHDLAIILVVAGIVTLLFKKLRQPVVLGYIVAGFLVSDKMPYIPTLADKGNSVEEWAQIGVIFLMFCLGLEFSVKKILKQGIAPVRTALVVILSMMTLGFCVGKIFGWTFTNCIFLGGMLAMSSTTIIYKAFDDLGLHQQSFASMVMSVLILEDIFGIILMVVLQTISVPTAAEGGSIWLTLVGIIVFLVATFAIGLAVIPTFFRSVRRMMTSETLLIVSLGLCCLLAYISMLCHFSAALGAFLIGSVLAETSEVERINKLVEPVKNLFGAIFFVSVGMLVDPQILISYWAPILVLVATIILGQSIFGTLGFRLGGQSAKGAIACGFSMTQIGEFSFIIANTGLVLGVISDYLYPVVVAVSVITTFTTPYMIKAAAPAYALLSRVLPEQAPREKQASASKDNQVNKTVKKAVGFGGKLVKIFYLQTKINAGSLPQDAHRLINRAIHISEISIPEDSLWVGKSLKELRLGSIYDVHISSILRGSYRINIPKADERLLPDDRLQVVGNDETLAAFSQALHTQVYKSNNEREDDMRLVPRVVDEGSVFLGKTLRELNLRERYSTMVVGIEDGDTIRSHVNPDYVFQKGDVLWLVCESQKEKLL